MLKLVSTVYEHTLIDVHSVPVQPQPWRRVLTESEVQNSLKVARELTSEFNAGTRRAAFGLTGKVMSMGIDIARAARLWCNIVVTEIPLM